MAEADAIPSRPAIEGFSSPRAQILLLMVVVSAANYARTALGPLQETMRAALALTDNQMGLLQGPAVAIPVVLGAIPLGLLIDRYSRVRLLAGLAVLLLLGTTLTALAPGFALLFAARSLTGLTAITVNSVALSLISDLFMPAQRGRATMTMAIGQSAGAAAVFSLGGMLLARFASDPTGWRWALAAIASPLVAVVVLALFMREPLRTGRVVENPSVRDAFREVWRFRKVITPLLMGLVMVETALGAAMIWATPALSRNLALPADRMGTIMALVMLVSGIVGPIGGGVLADRCERRGGPRRTLLAIAALALASAPAGLFAVAPGIAMSAIPLVVFISLVSAACVMATSLFTVVIPNELRGLCVGMLAVANVFFCVGLAPISVSALSAGLGGPASIGTSLALVCIITSLAGAGVFACGTRAFPRTALH
jgi:predicted MFS family arabinose efflux permease